MYKALTNRRAYDVPHDEESLAGVFRGRLFTAFMLSGPFALLASGFAYWLQRATDNEWIGLIATVLFIATLTNIAYQGIWWAENKAIYRRRGHLGWDGWVEMQRDLWPVHFFGLKTGFTFAILTLPLSAVVLGIATLASKSFAKNIPVPIIVLAIDAMLVQGPFLRLMGDFFDRHSKVLAKKYRSTLCDLEPEAS